MRLDRPIGIWLLLFPGLIGIVLASGGATSLNAHTLYVLLLFFVGAVLMRAAGCVVNDLWDSNLDKLVERTRTRPLAAGDISKKEAYVFLATLLLLSLFILLQLTKTAITLGVLVMPLIIAYPFMKRITWWPQAFLGITFNFSALMGWAAITNDVSTASFLLYVSCVFWTIGYDTIYAHQDKEDDIIAGIKSTALRFGAYSKYWVLFFYVLSFMSFLCALFILDTSLLSIVLAPLLLIHFLFQIYKWEPDCPNSSLKIFKSNLYAGLFMLYVSLLIRPF